MLNMNRVLVVESVVQIQRFLRRGLEHNGYRVYEATTGEAAITKTAQLLPEFVLIDMDLRDSSAFKLLSYLHELMTEAIIIVFLQQASIKNKVRVLEAGANAYLAKPFSLDDITACLRTLRSQAQSLRQSSVFITGDLRVDLLQREVSIRSEIVKLTPTEYAILYFMIRNAGKVVTHRQILETVWGQDQVDNKPILRVNFAQLRQKLEADPTHPRLLLSEQGVGYQLSFT